MRLHHVQVAMPDGSEDDARRFYADGLGLTEVDKPSALAGRGGCWFRAHEGGAVVAEIHLGVDDLFVPAKKAHPGLVLDGVADLETVAARIASLGFEVDWKERHTFDGYQRFHCHDGFGNRIEVLAPAS
ncbi:VOC family protein [Georgenia halophila]|uniref:VOC family protein n=1 Tax=Georgenia halophila TaxID=620889 RepID=A0ABP8LCC7_9MICO